MLPLQTTTTNTSNPLFLQKSVKSVKKFSLQCSLAPINPEQTGPPEKNGR